MGYVFIALTVAFTVYGQVVLKWQMNLAGPGPAAGAEKLWFLLRLMLNPWILTAFASAFLASLAWMAAMTKFQLGYAYPFVASTFVLVVAAGAVLFGEPITGPKIAGLGLIVAGITLASQG